MARAMIIPVFLPHQGCPHRCIFCNQTLITRETHPLSGLPSASDLDAIILSHLDTKKPGQAAELAFFGGNFLGLPENEIRRLLEAVQPYLKQGAIRSLRCSTRPDTVTPERLATVKPLGLNLVELGVQSMDDQVLALSRRGHTRAHTLAAMASLKAAGMGAGVQLMVGLPGDTREKALETARVMAALRPDLARIYPVLVLDGSVLAQWFRQGQYQPLGLDEAVDQAKAMVEILEREGVPVIRLGLQASESLEDPCSRLAGPWHPAFGHLVRSALVLDRVTADLKALLAARPETGQVALRISPVSESRLRGDKNANLAALGRAFPALSFHIEKDPALGPDQVRIRVLP